MSWDWDRWPGIIQFGAFRFSVEALSFQIGDALLPALKAVAKAVTEFTRAYSDAFRSAPKDGAKKP